MEAPTETTDEHPRPAFNPGLDEYRELGVNWRYWGDVRFKQMTVYFTATGALIAATFTRDWRTMTMPDSTQAGPTLNPQIVSFTLDPRIVALLLAALGLVSTIGFHELEERATFYRRAFMSCARALETTLGMPQQQYRSTYLGGWPDSGDVYRALLATVALFWLNLGATALSLAEPFGYSAAIATILLVAATVRGVRWRRLANKAGTVSLYSSDDGLHCTPPRQRRRRRARGQRRA